MNIPSRIRVTVPNKDLYPRSAVPQNYWKSLNNQRNFFDQIGKDLGIKSLDDWYAVRSHQIDEKGGGGLLTSYYLGSLPKAIQTIYPEHKWVPWKFVTSPKRYWNSKRNQQNYFEFLGEKLGIQELDDWYHKYSWSSLEPQAQQLLQTQYNSSIYKALKSLYPNHPWNPWRFKKLPQHHFDNIHNVHQYLVWLAEQTGVQRLEDWLYVPRKIVNSTLLKKYGSMESLLKTVYPQYLWSKHEKDFARLKNGGKNHHYLFRTLQQLLPQLDILVNYKHPTMLFAGTNREMELDIFIPHLNLALEYQGEHHYFTNPRYGNTEEVKSRDEQKRTACKSAGITLIEIPYWWNKSKGSLVSTLTKHRPDLKQNINFHNISDEEAIPEKPPKHNTEYSYLHSVSTSLNVYPFRITVGSQKGGLARCRGCLKLLTDRKELRIEVRGTYTPVAQAGIIPIKYYTCASLECLESARERYSLKKRSGAYLPSFENKIAMDVTLNSEAKLLIEQFRMKNIEIVSL